MKTYAKAFVGGLIAALSSAGTTFQIGNGFGWSGAIACALAGLITFSGVAFTPGPSK